MADTIDFEILEDGTISVKTSAVSDTNHLSADQLISQMETLTGGKVTKKQNPDAKHTAHRHSHNGAWHTH